MPAGFPRRQQSRSCRSAVRRSALAEQLAGEEQRRISIEARNCKAWRSFIARCLTGLADTEFVDLVGPAVATINAIIFNHLLTLIATKDIIEPEFAFTSLMRLWTWLWGADDRGDFFATLPAEDQAAAIGLVTDRHADAMTVCGLYWAAVITTGAGWKDDRVTLRELWRRLLCSPLWPITPEVLAVASRHATPFALSPVAELVEELGYLAQYTTDAELLAGIASVVHAAPGLARFAEGSVQRAGRTEFVQYIEITDTHAELAPATAADALALWRSSDPDRDYFRIAQTDAHHLAATTVAVNDVPAR